MKHCKALHDPASAVINCKFTYAMACLWTRVLSVCSWILCLAAFIQDTSLFWFLPQSWRPTLPCGFLPWVSTKWETLFVPIQSWSSVLRDSVRKQSRWRWVVLLSRTPCRLHGGLGSLEHCWVSAGRKKSSKGTGSFHRTHVTPCQRLCSNTSHSSDHRAINIKGRLLFT